MLKYVLNKDTFAHTLMVASLILVGCETNEFSDEKIGDRVKACSAGFSVGTQAALNGQVDKAQLSGQLSTNVKESMKLTIFDEIKDENLRMKVYEEYLKCVQTNWNFDK